MNNITVKVKTTKSQSKSFLKFPNTYPQKKGISSWILYSRFVFYSSIGIEILKIIGLSKIIIMTTTTNYNRGSGGVPVLAQWKLIRIQLGTMRLRVWSLASLSGLRIRHCRELWCMSKTWLGSRVAAALA